ncbi:hypothetical protein J4462_01370 [Candidatus Pacearchaeota archaeon]|nr:hypothetical protein [Candidatus Pacearchaeota archaeon]
MGDKTIILDVEYLCSEEKITRRLELLEEQTLDDLHEAIIYHAFGWDDPHMYAFYMDNKSYSKNHKMEYASHPEGDGFTSEKQNSTETKLKNLKLEKKQKFLFVFDFGDDHMFSIKVKDFSETKEGTKYPTILEENGKAPEQYPDYDEE